MKPFFNLIEEGNLARAQEMIIQSPALANASDDEGFTALHIAALSGNTPIVVLLLNHGADIEAKDRVNGLTPLHFAGNPQVASLLISHGANIEAVGLAGETPLYMALWEGHPDVVSLLCSNKKDLDIHEASALGEPERVTELLEANPALVNHKGRQGRTPLHDAVRLGQKDVVELLIDRGADMTATDGMGWTPLYNVLDTGHIDVASLLLARGASPNARDSKGQTPLHLAAATGDHQFASILLSKGADANINDDWGSTPIMIAELRNNKPLVEILRQHGGIDRTGCAVFVTLALALVASIAHAMK